MTSMLDALKKIAAKSENAVPQAPVSSDVVEAALRPESIDVSSSERVPTSRGEALGPDASQKSSTQERQEAAIVVTEDEDRDEPDALESIDSEPVASEMSISETMAAEPETFARESRQIEAGEIHEDSVAEVPAAADPATEHPDAAAPLAEEPLEEHPVDKAPVAEDPVAEDPVADDAVADDPVAEDPVAEDPVAEDPVAEQQPAGEATVEQRLDQAVDRVDDLVHEFDEPGEDNNDELYEMQRDEAVAWQTHNEQRSTDEPSFADQVAANQFDGDEYVAENLGADHLAAEYPSLVDGEPAFDPPIEPSPADFQQHVATEQPPPAAATSTGAPASDTPAADDLAALGRQPTANDTAEADAGSPDINSGRAANADQPEQPDIGDIPRLYLNSTLRNAGLDDVETPSSHSFAERLIEIEGDGTIKAPEPASPALDRPAIEDPVSEMVTVVPAAPESPPVGSIHKLDRVTPPTNQDWDEAIETAPEQGDDVCSEPSSIDPAIMPEQPEADVADVHAGDQLSAELQLISNPAPEVGASVEESAPPAEMAASSSTDATAEGDVAAELVASQFQTLPAELEPTSDQDLSQLAPFAFDATVDARHEFHAEADTRDHQDDAQPDTHVALDIDAAVAAGKVAEDAARVPMAAVVEPIVPRKSTTGRQPTAFEAEVRKLIFDPVVGTQIAEMFERIAEDCPHHGSFVLLSSQTESHVAEILGCMALVHALGNKKNVLLVDANPEKPLLSAGFNLAKSAGFSDACAEKNHWKSVVQPTATTRLSVLPAGSPLSELSNRSPVISILTEMAEEYDMVMVDGGKIDSQFALPLCHAADRNYLLVRLGRTPRELATAALEALRSHGLEISGTIVTNVPVGEAQ